MRQGNRFIGGMLRHASLLVALLAASCAEPADDANAPAGSDANQPGSPSAEPSVKKPQEPRTQPQASPRAWTRITPGDKSFTFEMPAEPKRHTQSTPTPYGTIKIVTHELVTAHTNYTAAYSDYPAGILARLGHDDSARLQQANEATARRSKATNVATQATTLDGCPALFSTMHVTIPQTGQKATLRKISAIVNNRVYIGQVFVLDGAPGAEHTNAQRFIDSFRLNTGNDQPKLMGPLQQHRPL